MSKLVAPPNPDWNFGQKVGTSPEGKAWAEAGEKADWTLIDAEKEEPR